MSKRARAGAAPKRGGRGWVSHLARLAAVGLGLALGALQQRRGERLAAMRVAARERGGAGRGCGADAAFFWTSHFFVMSLVMAPRWGP